MAATNKKTRACHGACASMSSPLTNSPSVSMLSMQLIQSNGRLIRGRSGRKRAPSAASKHTGTKIRKIHCHAAYSRIKAPILGPTTAADPTISEFKLMPTPILCNGQVLRTSPPNKHISIDVPTAWHMHDNSNPRKVVDNEHASAENMHISDPPIYMRCDPIRSLTTDRGSRVTTMTRL